MFVYFLRRAVVSCFRFGAMFKKFAQDTKTKMQAVSKPKTQSDSAQPEGEESHVERVPSTTEDQNIEQQPTDKPGSSGGAAAKMSAFSAALKHSMCFVLSPSGILVLTCSTL